jgi:hypothetical protein
LSASASRLKPCLGHRPKPALAGPRPSRSRNTAKTVAADQLRRKISQGQPIYGVDVKIADERGQRNAARRQVKRPG